MYKAILAYDGTHYFGWQKTRSGPSIQEELQNALTRITGESPLPEAASRTDRGVHAMGQVIQFSLQKSIEPQKLLHSLNAVLPQDIRLLQLLPCQFHPTLDAIGKEYIYRLTLGPVQDPIQRLYAWQVHVPLNLPKMEAAAQELIGTHDFTAFANEEEKDPICTLESISFKDALEISIKGNRFLYKMVRNIVGALVYIGSGKLASLTPILASRDRKQAAITAPAHGLHLHQVLYPLN
ncbi:MAG TPA: tRNA pseudouridine(38-40) synthase TruA [Chlamydiales bacterium]|nr:tRNA pseudouridine(38-40) synthase TruA [Chlamydiales bacterium]